MEHEKTSMITSIEIDIMGRYETSEPTCFTTDPLWHYLDTREPVAFQQLFIPIIAEARGRFLCFHKNGPTEAGSTSSDIFEYISEAALRSLEYGLLELLSHIASKVLETEFSIYRNRYSSALDRLLKGNASKDLYNAFIKTMYEGGFTNLLKEYPALLSLFATIAAQWIETSRELSSRLKKDFNAIIKTFNGGANPGMIKEINCGLSDRHNGGHTVAILTFDSGFKLVYKPRSLGMEEVWFQLLDELNNRLSFDFFKHVKVISHDTYGWMEFVEHLPCIDENDIKLYYRRAGAILCMVHCLRGTDCHCQNIIAHGTYPVVIDLETLFHPYSRELGINTGNKDDKGDMEKYHSVLRTGLLPTHAFKQDGKAFDLSGFGAGTNKSDYPKSLKWVHVNTDIMRQEYVEREISMPPHLPYVDNKAFIAKDYVNELIDGSSSMYTYIIQNKEQLLNSQTFLAFSKKKTRFVLRPTLFYFSLLSKRLETKYLKADNGLEMLVDSVLIGNSSTENNISTYPILHEEFAALNIFDIPYFTINVTSKILKGISPQAASSTFSSPALEAAKECIMHASVQDMLSQISFIKDSFGSK